MEENEKLQALLRLKNYERPPEGFFEDFLEDFHRRQRETLLKQSVFSLFRERISAALEPLRTPRAAWAAAGLYSVVLLLIVTWPKPDHSSRSTTVVLTEPSAAAIGPAGSVRPAIGHPVLAPSVNADSALRVGLRPGLQDTVPGKNRTATQAQDIESLIGPRLD